MVSITELLTRSQDGQSDAVQQLYAQLYPEIKRVARARLAHAGGVAGLNTTALVHEGFLRMAEQAGLRCARCQAALRHIQRLAQVLLEHRHPGRGHGGGLGIIIRRRRCQHRRELLGQPGVALAQRGHPRSALLSRQGQHLVQQLRQLRPSLSIDHRLVQTSNSDGMRQPAAAVPSFQPTSPNSTCSRPRALIRSRLMVRVDTPRSSATSARVRPAKDSISSNS